MEEEEIVTGTMKVKSTWIVIGVFAALGAYLYFVEEPSHQAGLKSKEEKGLLFPKLDPEKVRRGDALIRARVRGQDHAVTHMLDIVKRAITGVGAGRRGGRPRGVAFLAGATGVGKTELAKAVTELLFGDESAELADDTSFLETGMIDSTGVLELIRYVEETCGITVSDDEIVPDNLDSIAKISRFVRAKQGKS